MNALFTPEKIQKMKTSFFIAMGGALLVWIASDFIPLFNDDSQTLAKTMVVGIATWLVNNGKLLFTKDSTAK